MVILLIGVIALYCSTFQLGEVYAPRTAILYVYFSRIVDDMSCRSNFAFFLENGVDEREGVDFYFVIVDNSYIPAQVLDVQRLPNVHFVRLQNYKSDLCNVYHAIVELELDHKYDKFIILNCGARGPYGSKYESKTFYVQKFTNNLNDHVKLFGPVISCEQLPHVQTWFFSFDKVAMSLALNLWKGCPWSDWLDTIDHGEVGLSSAVLNSRYNIGGILGGFNPFSRQSSCTFKGNPGLLKQDLNKQIFVKYGGELLRRRILARETQIEVIQRGGWIGQETNLSKSEWVESEIRKVEESEKAARIERRLFFDNLGYSGDEISSLKSK